MKEDTRTSIEATNDAYQQRVDGLEAANKIKTEEAEKARKDSGIVSVEAPFSESAESQAIAATDEATDESDEDAPAKKTAAKKTAAKKG